MDRKLGYRPDSSLLKAVKERELFLRTAGQVSATWKDLIAPLKHRYLILVKPKVHPLGKASTALYELIGNVPSGHFVERIQLHIKKFDDITLLNTYFILYQCPNLSHFAFGDCLSCFERADSSEFIRIEYQLGIASVLYFETMMKYLANNASKLRSFVWLADFGTNHFPFVSYAL